MNETHGPWLRAAKNSARYMMDVEVALLALLGFSFACYGWRPVVLTALSVLAAVFCELLGNAMRHQRPSVFDGAALVTGTTVGLLMSPITAYWVPVLASAFAVVVVKGLFGGLGRNFANPAITARVFMLIAFSSVAGGAMPAVVELEASATPLEQLANGASQLPSLLDMFIGTYGGAIGETCTAALLIGFIYLLVRKVIRWHIPVVFIGTVFVCSLIASGDVEYALYQILGGGLFLGAIFMATDYVTCPITTKGKVVFALGCGLITFIIRYFCAYPEGVSFSILIMNLLVPYIERFTGNKPLGGSKNA